jgi:hypothetical protein
MATIEFRWAGQPVISDLDVPGERRAVARESRLR